MKELFAPIKWFWWLGVAYIPLAIHFLERRYMQSIGCPKFGDCYVPGSEILLDWDILVLGSAAFLWPVCAWFLVVAPCAALWRRLRPNKSFNPTPLRGAG